MTFGLPIKLLPFACCVMLPACQANRQPTTVGSPYVEVADQAPRETGKALCDAWLGSLASWADEDTEQTKDEVDYSIRVQEKVCAPFTDE